ncbi:MAG: MFS transporter [Gammaproteobacteria bacterium]
MPLPAGFSALNQRDFRVFWLGQLVSLIGTWMQRVGQAWLVLELTNSAFKLGLISSLQFTPVLLFAIPGGAIADRLSKRRLLMLTQTVLMLQALALTILVWTGHVRYWHVAVLATVYGLAQSLDMPTRQSFITDLVGKSHLMNAIALNSAMFNSARLIGPAVAGLLIARFGLAQAFLLNTLSFMAVIGALATLRTEGVSHQPGRATFTERIRGGIEYAMTTPLIRFILMLLLTVSLFVLNFNVIVPLVTKQMLHGSADDFGWLMASLGGGAIAGGLTLALVVRGRPPIALPVGAGLLVSAGTFALGFAPSFALASATLVVMGVAQITFQATCNTLLQLTAPDHLRGRVMSLYAVVFAGVTPFGALAIGWVAEALGTPAACMLGGAGGLVSVAILTVLWRTRRAA